MKEVYAPFIVLAVYKEGSTETIFLDSEPQAQTCYRACARQSNIFAVHLYKREQLHLKPFGRKGNPQ